MHWNWQQPERPRFTWSKDRLKKAEKQFLLGGGRILGFSITSIPRIRSRFVCNGSVMTA